MIPLILILWFTVTNRFIRGTDEGEAWGWPKWAEVLLSKHAWCVYSGIVYGLFYGVVPGIITAGALSLWCASGWGRGFLACHGWESVYNDPKGVNWIDRLLSWCLPVTQHQRRLYGLMWMTVRGMYLVPGIIALGVALATPTPAIVVATVLSAMMGVVYYVVGSLTSSQHLLWSELLTGALLALILLTMGGA